MGQKPSLQVRQLQIDVAAHTVFSVLHACIAAEMRQAPATHKIIVFFATANETKLGAAVLGSAGVGSILEIHSRKSQPAREKAAASFRAAPRAIMCTSDVSARGVDYPDVTLVIQVGLPASREQYIHRIGRTGRAGKGGQGMILLGAHESAYARSMLNGLPIETPVAVPVDAATSATIARAMRSVPDEVRAKAYQAWLGFHNSERSKLKWTDTELVRRANEYATAVLGLSEPPPLDPRTVGKMGLKGVPGLNVAGTRRRP
jgi:ATP-dependent RNA helicase MSS116